MQFFCALPLALALCSLSHSQSVNLDFDTGVAGWRTVLDGVMGGRSSGRVSVPEAGVLRFSGELSLENNGGFSQMQTALAEGSLQGATGIEARVRGDGRTYQFDVRCSNARLMAGSFQRTFDTVAGEWVTIQLPFDDFRLYNFGRLVAKAPKLAPERVESIGVTLADKNAGEFQLDVDFIRAIGAESVESPRRASLPVVAQNAGLTTLLSLVEASALVLPSDGVTIFAPSNEAFAAIPSETLAFLTSEKGRATLTAILKHHVVPSLLDSGSLLQRRGVSPLSGQNLAIDRDQLSIGGATLLTADVPFDGGIVHVIDRVMMPESRSVEAILRQDARISTLLTAVVKAGLGSQLGGENTGPWTLLAPSNEAFAALGSEAIQALLADPDQLARVLSAHVIPSRIRRSDMIAQRSARSLLGQEEVSFGLADGQITVSGARITAADIEAANGVIHIIDRVLIPSQTAANSRSAPSSGSSSPLLRDLFELAVKRGVPLFNEGNPAACAAIYEVTISAVLDLAPDALQAEALERLRLGLAAGTAEKDPTKRAWILRRALDRAHLDSSASGSS